MSLCMSGRALSVTTRHVAGYYAEGGWLAGNGQREWHDPMTTIVVNGVDTVRICGERSTLRVQWLEANVAVDDLTACTPPGLGHAEAVRSWLEAIGPAGPAVAGIPAHWREAA